MALGCPRCEGVSLEQIEIGEVVVDRCPRCAGIWFDHAEVGEIAGRRAELARFESHAPAADASEPYTLCPRCVGVPLRRLPVQSTPAREGLVLRCASCLGTWMDRGELREVEDGHLVENLKRYFSSLA